jgi:hypothetical protein
MKERAMKNGPKDFAPETALGTGAAEPVVSEYEAAKEVPTVDESLVKGKGSQNQPGRAATIDYSGEPTVEPTTGDDEKSTGEDYETRNVDNDDVPLAGAAVVKDDPEVNKEASNVRPEVPQATKATRKAKNEG